MVRRAGGVVLRRAELGDGAAMAQVEVSTALEAYADFFPADAEPPDVQDFVHRWEKRIAAGGQTAVFCAIDEGRIVGTACGQPDPDDPDQGYLASLYVIPDLWGRGIGRQLHDRVLDHLRTAGFAEATLWVIEQNVRSRAMYERWGWTLRPDRREAFAGSGVEEVRYVRAVTGTSQRGVA